MPREFEAEDSQEDGAPPVCDCTFFRKWQLPCSHIWHHHLVFGSLTPSAMEGWVWMWEEGGYELYESRTTEFISWGIKEEIGAPLRKRLDLGEVLTSLRSRYYMMEESMKDLDSKTASNVLDIWLGRLNEVLGSFTDLGKESLLADIGKFEGKAMY